MQRTPEIVRRSQAIEAELKERAESGEFEEMQKKYAKGEFDEL